MVAPASDVPPGARLRVEVQGSAVVIFNVDGAYYGLLDKCPHMGASLSEGVQIGLVESNKPGCYAHSRAGEIVRCPWHGWEFDLRTGKSRFDPNRWRTRAIDVEVEDAVELRAETVDVSREGEHIVVHM